MPSPYRSTPPSTTNLAPYNIPSSPAYSHITTTTIPPDSPTTPSTRLITISGQTGTIPTSTPTNPYSTHTPPNATEQITQSLANLSQCLAASGAIIPDIQVLRIYIVNYDPTQRHQTFHKPLANFLTYEGKRYKPAITLVPVATLASPGVVFEVEASVAVNVAPREEADVIVVGAGLSGLKAAWDLQVRSPELKVVVLEARDRVGGKTWSRSLTSSTNTEKRKESDADDDDDVKVDVGAAWINDTNQSYIWDLVKHFKMEDDCVIQNTNGNMSVENGTKGYQIAPYGGVLQDPVWQEHVVRVRKYLEDTCQKIDIYNPLASAKAAGLSDLDTLTLEEFVRRYDESEVGMNMVRISTRALLGVEPGELSALYFLDYCKSAGGLMKMRSDGKDGGQYIRLSPGVQEFSHRIASSLRPNSILLNSPVSSITQTPTHCIVDSARGSFKCSRVIVSIPTPLYREITFSPPLPPAKAKLANSTRLGCYGKSICVYPRPWWRDGGLCGLLQSSTGPAGVFRDTSVESKGHYSITCFMVGQPAREWGRLSKVDRDKAVLDQIQEGFGKFAKVERPLEIVEQRWQNEQWSQGCPCPVMPPGVMSELGHALREAAGRVHFVGTETAFEWKGYMDGAVRSGERGAKEVLRELGKAKL